MRVLQSGLDGFLATRSHHVVPLFSGGVGQVGRISGEELRAEAKVVGVIRHDQKIERPGQADRQPGGGHEFLAPRESIRILRPKTIAEGARIHRGGRVQMRVSPEDARSVIAASLR